MYAFYSANAIKKVSIVNEGYQNDWTTHCQSRARVKPQLLQSDNPPLIKAVNLFNWTAINFSPEEMGKLNNTTVSFGRLYPIVEKYQNFMRLSIIFRLQRHVVLSS